MRQDIAQLDGDGANLTGLDEQINEVYDFRWEEGSDDVLTQLGADGAVLPNNVAEDRDLAVGDSFTVRSTAGRRRRTSSSAASTRAARSTRCSARRASRRRRSTSSTSGRATASRSSTSDGAQAREASGRERARGFPDTRLFTRPEWIDKEDQEIQQFLLLLYVLLALSVIISLFGMVNTLALSVFERTRELGMLRAVGMTRRQTRRMIRHESVITALIGAALGLPLGIFLAALVTRALGQYDLRFELPVGQLVVLAIVAVIAGLLAAITPARRAAKLDPLTALQYE